ncbi:MAG: DMT family transporter [Oceanicoccus sp.]|uniref:DMT family transporter n=1 Tax=Oceanicoccus sp. TaxID=2691044 RepID=UPI00263915D8|nr:DMT family transporter [Oceanicoccus sp.]MCP3908876.1 DMT family transporter [Oceanicoccus sp.]
MLASKSRLNKHLKNSYQIPSRSIIKAIVAILITCLALSLGDAMIKQSSASFTLWQIFILRSAIAIPFLIYFVRIQSCETPVKPDQAFWTGLRSLILVLMWVFYYVALPKVPLSIAAAALYLSPLFITLFASIFIGDKIGVNGWIAVVLSFIGILLVLKPQSEEFSVYAMLPLISAVCYALAMIMTRIKCGDEKPLVLSLWLNVTFVIVGLVASALIYLWQPSTEAINSNPFMLGEWASMWLAEWKIIALLAVAIIIGSTGAAVAYQTEHSSTVATIDFCYVLFAALWGSLFFAEVLDLVSVVGIVLIIGGGILSVRRST